MPLPKLQDDVAAEAAGYETDFAAWSSAQAALIRTGRLHEADLENVAEEIESLGREQFSKLASAFRVLIVHILKWDHQPERRSRSWAGSIATQRAEISFVIEDNPSLRRRREDAIGRAYRVARLEASTQMDRSERTLPKECPYSLDDILNRPFPWPED